MGYDGDMRDLASTNQQAATVPMGNLMINQWIGKTPLTNANSVGLQSHVKYLEQYTHAPT